MTCREKLAMEHPELISNEFDGGCYGCPYDYGYLHKPDYCNFGHETCTICWNRTIPETEPTKHQIPWDEIRKLIDDVLTKHDRSVCLYIDKNGDMNLSILPDVGEKTCN